MLIEIKSRYDSSVIFAHDCENNTVGLTIEAAGLCTCRLPTEEEDAQQEDGNGD